MDLDKEMVAYRELLDELLGPGDANAGKYVAIKVVKDGVPNVLGPYATRDEALEQAYREFGLEGFLARKLERVEHVVRFTRGFA